MPPLVYVGIAVLLILWRDISASRIERERIKQQDDQNKALNGLALAIGTRADKTDGVLGVVNRELTDVVETVGALSDDVRESAESNRSMTASVVGMTRVTAEGNVLIRAMTEKFTQHINDLVAVIQSNMTLQRDSAQANVSAMLDLSNAVTSLQRNIEMTADDTRHILSQMNPKILKSLSIDYDVIHMIGATPSLQVKRYDKELVEIFGQTDAEMSLFTPLSLAGQWFDLKGSAISPLKTPTHRAMLGEENAQHLIFKNKDNGKTYDLYVTAVPWRLDNVVIGVHVTYSQVGEVIRETFRIDKLNHYPHHAPEKAEIANTSQQFSASPV